MRDNSVTIAKGIAIILMVMGHGGCPSWLNEYLFMLRMPLFFFMSGFCFKLKYLDDYKTFMSKRFNGIYKPYVKWSIFFLLMHNIFYHLNIYNDTYGIHGYPTKLYTINDFIHHLFYILIPMNGNEPLTGIYWFLKSLFWGSIIFYIVRKYVKRLDLCVILLLAITMLLSYTHYSIPIFAISSREFLAALFILIGHLFKDKHISFPTSLIWIIIYGTIVGIGAYFFPTSMLKFNISNLIQYIICALSGTLMIFAISKHLVKIGTNWFTNILIYTGNHTFNVLTWHLLSFKIVSLLIIFIYHLPFKQVAETTIQTNHGWWILYTIVGNAIPLIWIYYYEKIKDSLHVHKKAQ